MYGETYEKKGYVYSAVHSTQYEINKFEWIIFTGWNELLS